MTTDGGGHPDDEAHWRRPTRSASGSASGEVSSLQPAEATGGPFEAADPTGGPFEAADPTGGGKPLRNAGPSETSWDDAGPPGTSWEAGAFRQSGGPAGPPSGWERPSGAPSSWLVPAAPVDPVPEAYAGPPTTLPPPVGWQPPMIMQPPAPRRLPEQDLDGLGHSERSARTLTLGVGMISGAIVLILTCLLCSRMIF